MTAETRCVLVVDDDANALEALCAVIGRSGHRAVRAHDGAEALSVLLVEQVQVIVSDHDMPGLDGVQLLELVATRYPRIVRILLTGRHDAEPAVGAINRAQVYRFLSKPIRASELLSALHFAFDTAEALEAAHRMESQLQRQALVLSELRRRFPEVASQLLPTPLPPG